MKKVLLLLAEGFEIYEASVFIDVIGWNMVDGDKSTELHSCAMRKEIRSSFDQRFVVDVLVDEVDVTAYDALAIPGGFEEYGFYNDAFDERFLNLIRNFRTQGKPIASVCVGALPLAKSGILEGRKGTTYNQNPKRLDTLRACGVLLQNQPIVDDEGIITSWNPSTAIPVALLLLEKLTSRENAELIRGRMGF